VSVDNGQGQDGGAAEIHSHSLDALGIIGLRSADLALDNVACCGDCRNAVAGAAPFLCRAGYSTTVYSIKALYCPDFTSHEALPEDPQEDERSGLDRRNTLARVPIERRGEPGRRRDPEGWKRPDE